MDRLLAVLALCLVVLGGACAPTEELVPPNVLVSPYAAADQALWAVVPLRNESGTSAVDPLVVSDALVNKAAEVRGVACLPLNRTLAAMRALGMNEVRSTADIRRLGQALGADGVLIGSITAYDPYDPPKIGLTIALYGRGGMLGGPKSVKMDAKTLQSATTDPAPMIDLFADDPLAVATPMLDGASHEVQMNVKRYAEGRHQQNTALSWKRYLASMDLYTDFAAYWALHQLLNQEQLRVARNSAPQQARPR